MRVFTLILFTIDTIDDTGTQETSEIRWRPILGVESIIISVISMLSDPNDDSPANLDAAVSILYSLSEMEIFTPSMDTKRASCLDTPLFPYGAIFRFLFYLNLSYIQGNVAQRQDRLQEGGEASCAVVARELMCSNSTV